MVKVIRRFFDFCGETNRKKFVTSIWLGVLIALFEALKIPAIAVMMRALLPVSLGGNGGVNLLSGNLDTVYDVAPLCAYLGNVFEHVLIRLFCLGQGFLLGLVHYLRRLLLFGAEDLQTLLLDLLCLRDRFLRVLGAELRFDGLDVLHDGRRGCTDKAQSPSLEFLCIVVLIPECRSPV